MSHTITIKKLWRKNSRQQERNNTSVDEIKLCTVNGSGIYLPPSPHEEQGKADYFDDHQETFYLPCNDKLTYKRQLYTPSQIIQQ